MARLISVSLLDLPVVPVAFGGREQLSGCFEFYVDLLSERTDLATRKLLGAPLAVMLAAADRRARHFSGYCAGVGRESAQGRHARFRLTIRPGLWFLTRNADCRVFQDMTVPEIVKSVVDASGRQRLDVRLSASYKPWKYCVQYRESDFAFVSRLLEQEGIYYFFEHAADSHTMVLCDAKGVHDALSPPVLPFRPKSRAGEVLKDHLRTWHEEKTYPFGRYSLNEYDYADPGRDLLVSRVRDAHVPADPFEVYDYPGEYDTLDEGERYVGARIEEMALLAEAFQASGPAFAAAPGRRFRLADHPADSLNAEYLITAASYDCSDPQPESGGGPGASFDVALSAIRAQCQFRAPRITPKPAVQGVQTATVVGPAGEEIHTDPQGLGRVKVQFHWDRYGARDDKSSCWVRVASPWANQNFGFAAIPRVGSEVVVAFEEGDLDRPIIVGSVYNGANKPTYAFPEDKTRSGIKTRSSRGGDAHRFNELRFEDRRGAELVFVQAERDHHRLVKNDELDQVRRDAHRSVARDAFVTIGQRLHERIGSDHLIDSGGSVHQSAAQDILSKAGMRHAVEAGQEIHLKAGATLVLEAGAHLTLKAGDNFISIGPAGISLQGAMVRINSGGTPDHGSGVWLRAPDRALAPRPGEAIQAPVPRPARPAKPARLGPTAATMQAAAQQGAAFVPCDCGC